MTAPVSVPIEYHRRIVDDDLDALMPGPAAISIEGPKAVGKTATALTRATTVYKLDDIGQRQIIEARPDRLTPGDLPILVDEWQKWPPSWDVIRRAVDANPSPGRFLLTGSASPAGVDTHSGAGRIVPIRMRPLALVERGFNASVSLAELLTGSRPDISGTTPVVLDDYVPEILAGGFSGMRGRTDRQLRAALDGYLDRVIDRDFPDQGMTLRRPDTLRAWMRAYAAATSTTASFETIRDAATSGVGNKPALTTTLPWRDVLTRLWILDVRPHVREILRTVLTLADSPGPPEMVKWLHTLGYRGHITTKTRSYSTTMGELRAHRAEWRTMNAGGDGEAADSNASWRFVQVGHRNEGERLLALTADAAARASRLVAREELACQREDGLGL